MYRWQDLEADLRYAARRLGQAPGATAVAVLSLALGIGANTALFSLVNATLLRLIPVQRPAELVWFASPQDSSPASLNYPFYQSLVGETRFSGLLCAFPVPVTIGAAGAPAERVEGELVSGTYFATLGVRPHLGRLLNSDDDHVRLGNPVAVVSYSYWQARWGGDRKVIGRSILVNGAPYTLVGVSEPGFGGIEQGFPRSVFFPMSQKAHITPGWDGLDKPLIAWLWIVGRVRPGVDREALGHEMNARLAAFERPWLDADTRLTPAQKEIVRRRQVMLAPLGDAVLDARVRRHLRTLGWVVAALLLITCLNLAGVSLARGVERQRELATRLSLGASRGRLFAQLLVESLLAGLAGGAAGLAAVAALVPLLATRFPLGRPGSHFEVALDWRVLGFTLLVSLAASLAFGAAPAWQSVRIEVLRSLQGATHSPGQRRIVLTLLSGQSAAALLLLVVAGLFATNLGRLLDSDVGFARRHLVVAELDPSLSGYDATSRLALYRNLDGQLARVARAPSSGIRAAALSNVAPMSPEYWTALFLIDGRGEADHLIPRAVAVGPEYFSTLGIPLRRGRLIEERDEAGAPRVAVISESLARRAFPDSDPIGRRFTADTRSPRESSFEIVGIAADIDLNDPRHHDHRECVYFPYRQWPFVPQSVVVQARVAGGADVPAAIATLRRIVRDQDAGLALSNVRTVEAALDSVLAGERLAAWLTSFFALLATLLVAVGLYGIVAREVASRTREIGIRMALGASRGGLLWTLLRRVLLAAAAGTLGGSLALEWLRPRLEPLLVGVRPTDPAVLAVAALFLLVVATAALVPGRRATRIDPATALRWE